MAAASSSKGGNSNDDDDKKIPPTPPLPFEGPNMLHGDDESGMVAPAAKKLKKSAEQEDDSFSSSYNGVAALLPTEDASRNIRGGAENGTSAAKAASTSVLPQLLKCNVTQAELETAVKVLNAVANLNDPKLTENGLDVYRNSSNLRPLRKALSSCLTLHQKTMYRGKTELEHLEERQRSRSIKRQKASERFHQKNYIASTALRRGRVERLEKLKDDAKQEEEARLQMSLMIPDGHVDAAAAPPMQQAEAATMLLKNNCSQTQQEEDEDDDATAEPKSLPAKPRSCYVCKVRYRQLHHFYDQLCPKCAPHNWEKRHQTANLSNKVAVVTGSRVKIGFQTCLKLLRAGATVVATTRFPNAAAEAYRRQDDFWSFQDRLHIYGLDLRDVTGLEAFTRFLKTKYSCGIDILINNACQTVRRPRGYYVPMMEKEQSLWAESDDTHKSLLDGCVEFERVRRQLVVNQKREHDAHHPHQLEANDTASPMIQMVMDEVDSSGNVDCASNNEQVLVSTVKEEGHASPFETTGVSHSAAMSQMVILPEDVGVPDSVLPPGISDVNGQQLDLRSTNSWLLKMEEVSTPEIMECMFINAIAPFVLNSRLKPLMAFPDDGSRPDRFIINVSAMEGKFYRYKMPNHPHTNMAKAALNMMTRTSAEDLEKNYRIYMNAVDTGWINDENPLERASKTAKTNLFQTPIDEIDAAARILDPIFSGVAAGRDGKKLAGVFLKDYHSTEW